MSNVAKEKESEAEAEADQNVCSQEKISSSSVAKTERVELHDDDTLFSQPDGTHLGECPICFLPLPINPEKSMLQTCCSSVICIGCVLANKMSNRHDEEKANRCPFCREVADNQEESDKRLMKRVKATDPAALSHMGWRCYKEGDYDSAFEYLAKAAEFGDLMAHNKLGMMYMNGRVVEKDDGKAVYHWEVAAIGGHPTARHNLGYYEEENGNVERAVKHYIIAANLGHEISMKALWEQYSSGNITKEDLNGTLRKHQAAIDGTKSEQREAAEASGLFKRYSRG